MTSRSLHELFGQFKHSGMAGILVRGKRFFFKQEGDKTYYVCAVPKQNEDQCRALTRMGREKITAIMVHEIITEERAIEMLENDPKLTESFKTFVKGQKLCYVVFDVMKRDFSGKFPR